ncbi:non-histone chromosomal protein 6 [Mayamaea pseudoterrestris]|nr:non-histone chromosomal protein 6 [Mayamaea pseudoterrestris]
MSKGDGMPGLIAAKREQGMQPDSHLMSEETMLLAESLPKNTSPLVSEYSREGSIKPIARRASHKVKVRLDGKPHRPLSAYNFFIREARARIKADASSTSSNSDNQTSTENPRDTFVSVGKLLADRWKDISDDEKAKFQKLADEDMTRYQKAMSAYQLGELRRKRTAKPEMSRYASSAVPVLPVAQTLRNMGLEVPQSTNFAMPTGASNTSYQNILAHGNGGVDFTAAWLQQELNKYSPLLSPPNTMHSLLAQGGMPNLQRDLSSMNQYGQTNLYPLLQERLRQQSFQQPFLSNESALLQSLQMQQTSEQLRQAQLRQLESDALQQGLLRNMLQPSLSGNDGLFQSADSLLGPYASANLASMPASHIPGADTSGLLQSYLQSLANEQSTMIGLSAANASDIQATMKKARSNGKPDQRFR